MRLTETKRARRFDSDYPSRSQVNFRFWVRVVQKSEEVRFGIPFSLSFEFFSWDVPVVTLQSGSVWVVRRFPKVNAKVEIAKSFQGRD